MKFTNRTQAGELLAKQLKKYVNKTDVIVLALPRGGVIVAAPIAQALHVPLDLLLVKKLGVPYHEELAMGAIASDSDPILNEDVIAQCGISEIEIANTITQKKQELRARNALYRNNKPVPIVKNKIVILVDDGIATGATMRAGVTALRLQHPKKIVVAVTVADKNICDELITITDEVLCLYQPDELVAVGYWYEDFSQTTDAEVIALLKSCANFAS